MSRNEILNLKTTNLKKPHIYPNKDITEPSNLFCSTLKKLTGKPTSKPMAIKRMTSSQLINPLIAYSISPHQKKHQMSSSVPKHFFPKNNSTNNSHIHNTHNHRKKQSLIVTKSKNSPSTKSPKARTISNPPKSATTSISNSRKNSKVHNSIVAKHNNPSSSQLNTNNYIINTLNVSTKNVIGNSLDYADPIDIEEKLQRLQQLEKENEELKTNAKNHLKTIDLLDLKNKILEKKLADSLETNKKIIRKYNEIKESENQLLAMLYVIDQSGVPVDDIIDKFNKDNQPGMESNRSFDSAMYTPITLEHSVQPKPLNNIPKLNFTLIKSTQIEISHAEENLNQLNHSDILLHDRIKSAHEKYIQKDKNNLKSKIKLQLKK